MKKTLTILLALMMLLMICGCQSEKGGDEDTADANNDVETPSTDGTVSPVTELSSLEELNDALGCNFTAPAAMGVTNESFCVIDDGETKIGQYCFSLNGVEYTYRFSKDIMSDISGVYTEDGTTLFSKINGEGAVFDGVNKGYRWLSSDGQYTLTAVDETEYVEEDFLNIAEEIKQLRDMAIENSK